MRTRSWCASLLAAALLAAVSLTSAQAQATRTWVSGVGDDANPCSRTAPCKTFAGAISKTAAGGEINCIDAGGFGAVTITKSIVIDCTSTEAGVLVAGTNGIVVSAGASDVIILRGLDLTGTITTPALNGVVFNTGAALQVENCRINTFLSSGGNGFGILFRPSAASKLIVSGASISFNGASGGGGGILVKPTGSAVVTATISNSSIVNNVTGITIDGTGSTGTIFAAVNDTVIAGSSSIGNAVTTPASGGASVFQTIQRATIANNGTGINASGAKSVALISNLAVAGNGTGLTASGGGKILSYTNNQIDGNQVDGAPTGSVTSK